MKIDPYLYFNGNASDAIVFYEKAFETKAVVAKYSDTKTYDPSFVIPQGTENYVMHSNMKIGETMLMICDVPTAEMKCSFANGMQLMVSFDSVAKVEEVFDILKQGGEVVMEPQKTFWSDCFASLRDKFGICWLLSYENEEQRAASYGN